MTEPLSSIIERVRPKGPEVQARIAETIAAEQERRRFHAWRDAAVPPKYQSASFTSCLDIAPAIVEDVRTWAKNPVGMVYLCGPVGTGKTWLGVSALRQAICLNDFEPGTVLYVSEADYLASLRRSYGATDGEGRDSTQALIRPTLLLLDDVLSGRLTDWGKAEIAAIIERRYAHERATILTSNLSLTALATALDARVSSRIAEYRHVHELGGRDLRLRQEGA